MCAVKEAVEASWWLRAAGFPQYVQLFEGEATRGGLDKRPRVAADILYQFVGGVYIPAYRGVYA